MKTMRSIILLILVCLIKLAAAASEESLQPEATTQIIVTDEREATTIETNDELVEVNELLETTTPRLLKKFKLEDTTLETIVAEDTELTDEATTTPAAEVLITTTIAQEVTTKLQAEESTTAATVTESTTAITLKESTTTPTPEEFTNNTPINEESKPTTSTITIEVTTTPQLEDGLTTTPTQEESKTTPQPEECNTSTAAQESTTTPISAEEITTTTTPLSIPLEDYAMKQVEFVVNHILNSSYLFVSQVLQESDNFVYQRDKLKRYTEYLYRLLHDDDVDDDDPEYYVVYTAEDTYNLIVKKLNFLQSKATRLLHKYLPEHRMAEYKNYKEDISIWLDKTGEQMRTKFNYYVTDEEDHVKYLYFNESFDDIPRANEIHQKLWILGDLLKIALNKKQISFMDLYMQ